MLILGQGRLTTLSRHTRCLKAAIQIDLSD